VKIDGGALRWCGFFWFKPEQHKKWVFFVLERAKREKVGFFVLERRVVPAEGENGLAGTQ